MCAGEKARGLLVEPLLRVDLAVEVTGVLLARVVAVARPPPPVRALGDVSGHEGLLPVLPSVVSIVTTLGSAPEVASLVFS